MPPERDLFANFERMRREMDELFGDVFDRGMAPVRRGGFSPAVALYYSRAPPPASERARPPRRDRPRRDRARDPRPRPDPLRHAPSGVRRGPRLPAARDR